MYASASSIFLAAVSEQDDVCLGQIMGTLNLQLFSSSVFYMDPWAAALRNITKLA
jgi:hypothetical protein